MAVLALGMAGAAIGGSLLGTTTILGLSGASIGWGIGTILGGQLFREKLPNVDQQGPRIMDFRVQSSTYGQSIPRVYGRARLAGNLIWSSGVIETPHVSSQTSGGGKGVGGGSQTVTTTTYSYAVHLAIGVCEGPISGIRKIWANGKLIYNSGDSVSAQTIYASNSRADNISIYTGTSSQPVNSLIESYVGSGNAPAYRNLAYVVLNNFQLADFGNTIPSFEFEVLDSADDTVPATLGDSGLPSIVQTNQVTQDNGVVEAVSVRTVVGVTYTSLRQRTDLAGNVLSSESVAISTSPFDSAIGILGNWPGLWFYQLSCTWLNILTGATAPSAVPTIQGSTPFQFWKTSAFTSIGLFNGARTSGPTGNWMIRRIPIDTSVDLPGYVYESEVDTGFAYPTLWCSSYWDGSSFWLAELKNGVLRQYDAYLNLLATYAFTGFASTDHRPLLVYGDRAYFGRSFGNSTGYLYQLNSDLSTTLLGSGSVEGGSYADSYPVASLVVGTVKTVSLTPLLSNLDVTLDDVVTDLCERAGLSASDLNVSALSSTTLTGYIAARRTTLRDALTPLMQAFFFDAVESDGKLKFVLRSGSSVVTIPDDDLAAREAGADAGNIVDYSRTEELALPNEVMVGFINDTIDYQMGAQYARRLAAHSDGQISVELPIVLTDSAAKVIADASLYDAWRARESFGFKTSRKYAKYEPGDVVTIPNGDDNVDVRITQRDDGANGVIEFRAILSESSVYNQAGTTQGAVAVDDEVGIPGSTLLELMDIPQLRDDFDRYGFYAAARGWLDGWTGAALYKSNDGGTYAPIEEGVFVNGAVVGYAKTVLGQPLFSEQFDEKCTVSIQVYGGTLDSVSRDDVINGENFCLLGDELLQFRDATLTAANTYTLSGLLRGRLGTERALATHATGERFVLLTNDTVRFIPLLDGDVDVERIYRAPSFGNFLQSAPEEPFTYEGVNLMPLSAVHVRGTRDASANLTITWIRRTRARATWRDGVDAPLAEATEAYEVDIYNGASVVRTISVTTATASYSAAQQTTDFGSTQASVTIAIYQISARVGRGFPANATV